MKALPLVLLFLSPLWAVAALAPAPDTIWSAVVLATNPKNPKEAPVELREYEAQLKRIFGYEQFEVIGSADQGLADGDETWLVPSKPFALRVRARRAVSREARGGYLLNLQLFQEKRVLVETEAKLAPGSPLFIRGPQYGNGQIIFVLRVQ